MTLMSEITRIDTNIKAAYTALDGKGATLPATQNSANLADTIDTITTGGGGNAVFTEIDSMISDAVTWLENKSYEDCYENGWLVPTSEQSATANIYSSATNTVCGVVFNNNIPDSVYVRAKVIKAPEGSTISTQGLTSPIRKITFPANCENKWIIAAGEHYFGLANGMTQIGFTSDVTNGATCSAIADSYRYINIALRANSYSSASPYSVAYPQGGVWQAAKNLEGLKFSDNIKFTLSSALSGTSASFLNYLAFPASIDLKDFFEKYISDVTYQSAVLSTSISDDLIRSNSYMKCWLHRKDFPFIVDCSGFPSNALSNTWYVGYVPYNMTSYYTEFDGFTDVKIKLPAMNVTINYNNNRFVPIEYLRYMANNAPSVSGKTLKLGSFLKAIVTEVDSSIITTFEGKGWTVS